MYLIEVWGFGGLWVAYPMAVFRRVFAGPGWRLECESGGGIVG